MRTLLSTLGVLLVALSVCRDARAQGPQGTADLSFNGGIPVHDGGFDHAAWGFGVRAGIRQDIGPVFILPEGQFSLLTFAPHSFEVQGTVLGDLDSHGIADRLVGGGRLGANLWKHKIVEPSFYAHAGWGHVSVAGLGGEGVSWDMGGEVDGRYERLFFGLNVGFVKIPIPESSFRYVDIGLHIGGYL